MRAGIPTSQKTVAIATNLQMTSVNRFIRTTTPSHNQNHPKSQIYLPFSHSLYKASGQINKYSIQPIIAGKASEAIQEKQRQKSRKPQNSVNSRSRRKFQSVQDIAMKMLVSIFLNSTTKFVKGIQSSQAQTQSIIQDIKNEIPTKNAHNLKNQEKVDNTSRRNRNLNATQREYLTYNSQPNIVLLKPIETKSLINQQPILQLSKAPQSQKAKLRVQPNPEFVASNIKDAQISSSNTKSAQNIALTIKTDSAFNTEPNKDIFSSPAYGLQSEQSFTPIKQTISVFSNTAPMSSPINKDQKLNQEIIENGTHRIQRRRCKALEIKLFQQNQEYPVSILVCNSAEKEKAVQYSEKQAQSKKLKPVTKKVISVAGKLQSLAKVKSVANFKGQDQSALPIAHFKNNLIQRSQNKQTDSYLRKIITKNSQQPSEKDAIKGQGQRSITTITKTQEVKATSNHKLQPNTQKKIDKNSSVKNSQESFFLSSSKIKEVVQNQPDYAKLNTSKSAQTFESVWKRYLKPNRVAAETTRAEKEAIQSNKFCSQGLRLQHKQNVPKQNLMPQTSEIPLETTKINSFKANLAKSQNKIHSLQNINKPIQTKSKNSDNLINNLSLLPPQVYSSNRPTTKDCPNKIEKQHLPKKSSFILYYCSQLIFNRKKQVLVRIKDNFNENLRRNKQLIILINSLKDTVFNVRRHYQCVMFGKLKRGLLVCTETKKHLEISPRNRKQQVVNLLFRLLQQKHRLFFLQLKNHSWIHKQISITNVSFANSLAQDKTPPSKPSFLNNLVIIFNHYHMLKMKRAFDKLICSATAVVIVKAKKVQDANSSNSKKMMEELKSLQKPAKNYTQERNNLLQSKSEIQAYVERTQYLISDKKRAIQFQREQLIKKMDVLHKKNSKIQVEVLDKRARNQKLQTLIANVGTTFQQLEPDQNKQLFQTLTLIYSDLLKSNYQILDTRELVQRYKFDLNEQSCHPLLEEWNTLSRNAKLKGEIDLWQGYERREQPLIKSLKEQQRIQRRMLRSYIKEQYLWQWLHSVANKL